MRVVFDTSVLVRAALGSASVVRLLHAAIDRHATLLVNEMLVTELAITLRKPRIAAQIDRDISSQLLAFLTLNGEQVPISSPFPACRDPNDAYLLALASLGRADFLVTLDLDLLELKSIEACAIVTPREFANSLKSVIPE